uniref:GST C-terminal domain-containing protein n=1 Tax=Plectus sambesii TaxID=2011161 RepID=A0A914V6H6_9BILA
MRPAFHAKEEEEKKKLMASVSAEHVAPYLARLEKRLSANGTGYFVGKDLTIADITFMEILTMMKERVAPGLVEKHPKLIEFIERIKAQPKIKEWIEKRPKTEH